MFLSQKWSLYFQTILITIFLKLRHTEARSMDSNDTQNKQGLLRTEEPFTEQSSRLPLKGDTSINYGNLKISEPGFDFTDEEIEKLKIWPGGNIPYFIDDFSFDKVLRDKLRAFLEHTNTVAGVQFSELSQPPSDDSRWVFFINRRGVLPCADLDFRSFNSTGVQKVVIGYDCMDPGDLAEMVLALVGVPPQHNSPDRDKYVEVQKDNILSGKEHLFEKFSDTEWVFHDVEYDFTSAGHYGYHKYTANGGATLKPLEVVDVRAGEATSFSHSDIWKIRMLYNFISKKGRKGNGDRGSCSKLFKPGAKFNDFIPSEDEDDEIKPRPKPSKYTGKSEEKSPEVNNDDEDEKKENSYKNEENNNENNVADDDNGTNDDNDADDDNVRKPAKLKKPKVDLKLKEPDYNTDEKK